jgi:hypothetical protein
MDEDPDLMSAVREKRCQLVNDDPDATHGRQENWRKETDLHRGTLPLPGIPPLGC